jgi:Rps23 Pro-64 3,4-dihydroxylase Tpa1-like proline 4-hydroxylase
MGFVPAEALAPTTHDKPYIVVDDFLPTELAEAMRADIDAHFADPGKHRADKHQIWNYWYVHETYTYLRTLPEKIVAPARVEGFMTALREWSLSQLGLTEVTSPYLSLYVPGCSQALHNDALNGRIAFVYSLTKPVRQTVGGETLVMTEGDPFRRNLANPMAIQGFCSEIEPRFNRLVLFDDRLIHGVKEVRGSMDPVEGRFVFHGHLKEGGPTVTGAQPYTELQPLLQQGLGAYVQQNGQHAYNFHGPIVVRFVIGGDGIVGNLHVMFDRVTHVSDRYAGGWEELRRRYLTALSGIRYAAVGEPTTVILPIIFAGPAGRAA